MVSRGVAMHKGVRGNGKANWRFWRSTPDRDDLLAELNASNGSDDVEDVAGDNSTTHTTTGPNLQLQQPSPQSRRRSLPSTPPGHQDHRVFETLKSSIEKVIEENITIKETLHSMTLRLQDFDHVHDCMKSLTAELNSYKIEVESCQENIKREQTPRKSLEDQLQHQVNQYQELKKKMTEDMAQVYPLVRESEENLEKVKSENDELRQNNSTLLKENEAILQRVKDLEKETNVIQEHLFEGELAT